MGTGASVGSGGGDSPRRQRADASGPASHAPVSGGNRLLTMDRETKRAELDVLLNTLCSEEMHWMLRRLPEAAVQGNADLQDHLSLVHNQLSRVLKLHRVKDTAAALSDSAKLQKKLFKEIKELQKANESLKKQVKRWKGRDQWDNRSTVSNNSMSGDMNRWRRDRDRERDPDEHGNSPSVGSRGGRGPRRTSSHDDYMEPVAEVQVRPSRLRRTQSADSQSSYRRDERERGDDGQRRGDYGGGGGGGRRRRSRSPERDSRRRGGRSMGRGNGRGAGEDDEGEDLLVVDEDEEDDDGDDNWQEGLFGPDAQSSEGSPQQRRQGRGGTSRLGNDDKARARDVNARQRDGPDAGLSGEQRPRNRRLGPRQATIRGGAGRASTRDGVERETGGSTQPKKVKKRRERSIKAVKAGMDFLDDLLGGPLPVVKSSRGKSKEKSKGKSGSKPRDKKRSPKQPNREAAMAASAASAADVDDELLDEIMEPRGKKKKGKRRRPHPNEEDPPMSAATAQAEDWWADDATQEAQPPPGIAPIVQAAPESDAQRNAQMEFFTHCDKDSDGKLCPTSELPKLFLALKFKDKDGDNFARRIGRYMEKHDIDQDGFLEFNEFAELYNDLRAKKARTQQRKAKKKAQAARSSSAKSESKNGS